MDVKNHLKQMQNVNRYINSLILEQKNLAIDMQNIKNVELLVSNTSHYLSETVLKHEEKIKKELTQLFQLKTKTLDMIDLLNDYAEKTVIRDRYINFLTVEEVAEKNDMSISWVKSAEKKALKTLSALVN